MALDVAITVALRTHPLDVELTAGPGTLALVGPSGAGKTTLLRAIAGLVRPARGRIALDGRPWFDAAARVDLPPEARSVGFVFQEYALFPHLTVRENVAFGAAGEVDGVLGRLGLDTLAGARPGALSGGERQRVAVARALARDPEVLLLDEPLSALDAHTRAGVRAELQEVLARHGRPAIVVTHDFADAAALAGRVGVLVDGRIRQTGTPAELLARPAVPAVAALTGGNLVVGDAEPAGDGTVRVRVAGGELRAAGGEPGRVGVSVHPWDVRVQRERPAAGGIRGRIAGVAPEGSRVRLRVGELAAELAAAELERLGLRAGDEAWATAAPEAVRLVELGGDRGARGP